MLVVPKAGGCTTTSVAGASGAQPAPPWSFTSTGTGQLPPAHTRTESSAVTGLQTTTLTRAMLEVRPSPSPTR